MSTTRMNSKQADYAYILEDKWSYAILKMYFITAWILNNHLVEKWLVLQHDMYQNNL